jgi:hypothetical protein
LFFLLISPRENVIHWSYNNKLKLEDFQGDPIDKYMCLSVTVLIGTVYCNNGKTAYTSDVVFDKDLSWVGENAKDNYILNHEQKHFDLTELFSRKIRFHFDYANYSCDQMKEANLYVSKMAKNLQIRQHLYDYETRHSLNVKNQTIWNNNIQIELNKYSEYASDLD